MGKWRFALVLVVSLVASGAHALTLNPGDDLNAAIASAAPGTIITLNAGNYSPITTTNSVTGAFVIGNNVTIRGATGIASDVHLKGSASAPQNFALYFTPANGSSPNGATLENVTVETSPAGIRVHDYFGANNRLHDITLRNVVVNINVAAASPEGFGVLVVNNDRIVLDNVTVTAAYQNGFQLLNTTDSLLMNSTVTSTGHPSAPGLAVIGGSDNRIVGNTFGTPKSNPADSNPSTYSFKPGGVVLYNTTGNRFENNLVQGFRADGVDVTLQNPAGGANSVDNYVGKNTVISTGLAVNTAAGTTVVGGTGIWTYCGSHNTWVYGNDSSGAPEGGLSVWSSNSNMALANRIWGSALGIFVSGDVEATTGCAYPSKPNSNYLRSNSSLFNKSEQIIVRSVDTSDVSLNFASPRNGRLGSLQTPSDATNGQSAITFQTLSGSIPSSTGFRMVANISSENQRGIWDDSGKDTGIEFFLNRILGSSYSRIVTSSAITLDAGSKVGGNHWGSLASVLGNPSTTPYSGVYQNLSNSTGLVVDHNPFQSEDLGRGSTLQVSEPLSGLVIAAGTKRTVRWTGLGCIYNDILLDGSVSLLADAPNTGYAVVTIPSGTAAGSHNVVVKCKNSAGTVTGQASSPNFTVKSTALQLMTPGRDDVFNANTQIFVGWKKTTAITAVNVKLSVDGGATFPYTLASGATGTAARVTLPAVASSAYAVLRVESATTTDMDSTDGVFALRGTSGAGFTNVSGRVFTMGQVERIEWASPQNSRLVTITANGVNIANNLPDRGFFDWIPKDFGLGTMTLNISFKQSNGTGITSASAAGSTAYLAGTTPPPPPPSDARLFGISTRSLVLTGDNVMIAGFIIGGSTPKTVVVRARGPSLGVPGALADPTLTLVPADGSPPTTNDDWQSAGNAAQLQATGFQPGNAKESAIMATLNPGAYTAIVSGAGGTVGVGIVEVYEIDHPEVPMIGISTRARVDTGDNVMIGGVIIQGTTPRQVVVRARGPSLGVPGALADPVLTLVPGDGSPTITNDNWQTASNAAQLQAIGFQPGDSRESAILVTLNPGAYTAIVSGAGGTSGVAIVEVYQQ